MARPKAVAVVLLIAALFYNPFEGHAAPLRSIYGEIVSLNAVGAIDPGDPIHISSSSQAKSSLQKTNLYYELYDPSGALVDTRQINADRLEPGDVVNDSWSSSNTPNTGTYSVTLCWSTGQAHNCDIDYKETSFYSVPSLGWSLSLIAAGLLVVFLVRRKDDFSEVTA